MDAPESPFIEATTAFLTGEKISHPVDDFDPATLAMVRLGGGALTAEAGDGCLATSAPPFCGPSQRRISCACPS